MLSAVAKSWLFSVVLALAIFAPQRADADGRFGHHRLVDRIVVFGDSLSDPGNAFDLLGVTVAPPSYGMDGLTPQNIPEVITLIPDAPYATERFSNGLTWIELIARATRLDSAAKPAITGMDRRASNYAVGGATAGNLTALGGSPFHLAVQRDNFFSDFNVLKRGAPADALYVIALGGNDVRFMIGAPDPATAGAALTAALTAISETVGALYANGARRFLIWNAPDLGRTPALRRLDAALCGPTPGCVTSGATGASALYNQHLQGVVQGLSALPGIAIVQFDTFQLLADVQANPGRFGLLDATSACIQPFVPPLFRCALPDRHFFWDGIHPTRAGHAIIAFLVGKTLVSAVLQDD